MKIPSLYQKVKFQDPSNIAGKNIGYFKISGDIIDNIT